MTPSFQPRSMAFKSAPILKIYNDINAPSVSRRNYIRSLLWFALYAAGTIYVITTFNLLPPRNPDHHYQRVPIHAEKVLAQCAALKSLPGPAPSFSERVKSERAPPNTRSYLIHNATIWTGRKDGKEVLKGDVLLQDGLIKSVGGIPKRLIEKLGKNLIRVDANGSWVTPGIFDMHSHIGVASIPELSGSQDIHSTKGLILPWLKSIDGINVFDEAMALSVSGGVTTSLILPGSADAIDGQAFVIKLRPTEENSPMSMVLEPPFSLNDTSPTEPPHWRHMKFALGENPSRFYEGTRMDTMWALREAYNEARKFVKAQDEYCAKAEAGLWHGLSAEVPTDLKWEALADVLRGKVKVNIHSYSSSDYDGLVRLTNEFKFHVAAIHHATQAFLVTPLLEKMYGGKPAVAIFATNARYKQEAYRGTEFAAKILTDAGFQVVVKSDGPFLDSRRVLHEAQQAYIYGLPENKAIQSVTTFPAENQGFGHRLGYVRAGYDADIVIWDSHPLALGATPQQVFIDGLPQLENPIQVAKPTSSQKAPNTPDWTHEIENAIKYRGLPPLYGQSRRNVVFTSIKSVWERDDQGKLYEVLDKHGKGIMHFVDGELECSSFRPGRRCPDTTDFAAEVIDLNKGSMGPGLTSIGGWIGVREIEAEWATNDGLAYGPFDKEFVVVGNLDRAVDGLAFDGRNQLLAYRSGVTTSVTPPQSLSMFLGLSVAFSNGASHSLEQGAIIKEITALHVAITNEKQPSISTQTGLLRQILLSGDDSAVTGWFRKVAEGQLPLIIHTHSADVMARCLALKIEVENKTKQQIKMAFLGGLEAHLIPEELAGAEVGVVVAPSRSYPLSWDRRRSLPGPPLTKDTVISVLLEHNVTVGIGVIRGWEARNTRFDLTWAALEADGRISRQDALALASTNLEKIFGIEPPVGTARSDWVAYRDGDVFDFGSKVVAVISLSRGRVDVFEGY